MKKHLMTGLLMAFVSSQSVIADQIINDDLIVVGSSCIGIDCLPNTEFDFDTVKIVSPKPGINFVDTSSAGQFPTTDWKLGVVSDGQQSSYLAITDSTSDIEVLKLAAAENGGIALGAGAALVDNAISVGSSTKQRRVTHVADGVNPTDGVNYGQLQALEGTFEPKVTELEIQMAELLNRIEALNTRLDDLQ